MTKLPWADFTRQWTGHPLPRAPRCSSTPIIRTFHPTWLTRHYGACSGWPGVHPATLATTEPVHCRYRIWVHRGRPDADQIAHAFSAFSSKSGSPLETQRAGEPSKP